MDDDLLGDAGNAEDQIPGSGDAGGSGFSDIFVPPSSGADPLTQALKKNPQNVGLHIATGEFAKALELLRKQLGIHDFTPLRQAFIDIHTLSKMKL